MSRCFPFPPPSYVKIGERGGEGSIEIDSIKKEIKKAEKERKREKKCKKKEKKELLKKQQGVSDVNIDKLDGKKSLQGDGKKTNFGTAAVLSENQSRSGLSEEHGQAIPESTFYLSDDTDSSKKRKREEQAPLTVEVERKGTKLKLCFSFKKPSTSETPSAREEPTCSTSSLQNPSVSETQVGRQQPSSTLHGDAQQPHHKKPRLAPSQEPFAALKGDVKPITNRSHVRPPPLQKASASEPQHNGRGQSTLASTSGAVPPLQKASASKVQHIGRGQPTLSVSGVVRSQHVKTSLAAAPSSSTEVVTSRDVVSDRGVLKPPQVQKPASEVLVGRDQPACSAPGVASSQEILPSRDVKQKSDRKDRKQRRHESIESMYKSLLLDWVPPSLLDTSEASEDGHEWLFGSKTQGRAVPRSCNTDAADVVMLDSQWPPRAHYFAAAEIHALPFTVPF